MKLAPTAAPMIARTTVITKAKSGTNNPCLTPERLAMRPATYPPIKKAMSNVRRTPMRPAAPPPMVAELPPRAEKMAPTIAPTMALKTKLTPRATNQPTMTLVQLVPRSALSLTPPPYQGDQPGDTVLQTVVATNLRCLLGREGPAGIHGGGVFDHVFVYGELDGSSIVVYPRDV